MKRVDPFEMFQATAAKMRPEIQAWIEAHCQDCREVKRLAYSDATTPGFFYTACDKHRVRAEADARGQA